MEHLRAGDPNPNETVRPCCCCGSRQVQEVEAEKPCCGPAITETNWSTESDTAPWILDAINTPIGPIPRVRTDLGWHDRLGTWKVRWGIHRMQYAIKPRLYAVGNPTPDSPVFVSANYKMSFDRLRSSIAEMDAWILVLDTKGVNVWCAAGKGTFGTEELIRSIEATGLPEVVSHKQIILPQLGASGVAAHEVQKRTGFRVVYGPVRANDICTFLQTGMKATPQMRRVEFTIQDRLAVVPIELILAAKQVLFIGTALILLAGFGPDGYTFSRILTLGLPSAVLFLVAFLAGTVLGPLLLPWLPGRAFSAKGAWIGIAMAVGLALYIFIGITETPNWFMLTAWVILLPVITSFALMNFTGASTYTSLSGVRREMRIAVPLQTMGAVAGIALWFAARFV